MTLTIPDDVRAKAEVYLGDAAGQEKTRLLLQETGLPSGLLPLRDIIECGYVEETGFVWLRQRRKVDHYFAKAGRHVSYGAEVSAVAEEGRLKKITGVKAKEMLIWVTLHEICLDTPPTGKLQCKAIGGLSRTFPVEAFEAEPLKPAGVGATPTPTPPEKQEDPAGEQQQQEEEEAPKTKEEEDAITKKEEEAAAAGKKTEEEKEKKEDAAAVDKIEEKLKEMTTDQVVHAAEPVIAKN